MKRKSASNIYNGVVAMEVQVLFTIRADRKALTRRISKGVPVLPLVVLLSLGCASRRPQPRVEDVFLGGEGRVSVALRFPSGLGEDGRADIPLLRVKKDRSSPELWLLARHYHVFSGERDRFKKALSYYETLMRSDQDTRPLAANNTACIFMDMGKYREAEKLLQDLVSGENAVIPAFYNLSALYRAFGREDDALRTLLLMREKYPENAYASIEIGDILVEREDYGKAEEYYAEAMKADRDNPVPLHRMARVKELQGAFDKAEGYYRRCIARYPLFRDAYMDYSRMLLTLNRQKDASKVLNKMLRNAQGESPPADAGAGDREDAVQ